MLIVGPYTIYLIASTTLSISIFTHPATTALSGTHGGPGTLVVVEHRVPPQAADRAAGQQSPPVAPPTDSTGSSCGRGDSGRSGESPPGCQTPHLEHVP